MEERSSQHKDTCPGNSHNLLTFITKSGRNVATPTMPMPDFAVPYAAPMPVHATIVSYLREVGTIGAHRSMTGSGKGGQCVHPKIMAAAMPPWISKPG